MDTNKIESAKYQGYLWKSDQTKPQVFLGDETAPELVLKDGENPFVIEGNLYEEETGNSISIKYVDGKYIVGRYNLTAKEKDTSIEISDETYLTNIRIVSASKCPAECEYSIYKRIWKEESDEDWKELKPFGFAFAGFSKTTNMKED